MKKRELKPKKNIHNICAVENHRSLPHRGGILQ